MILLVGLGNIGSTYEDTRHNIGFKVIDKLLNDFNPRDISKNSFYGKAYRSGDIFFLKPSTFMNLSGKSAQPVKNFFKIDLEDIIVIHDDIDLPFGALRFKRGGGSGGHNGLKSLDEHIGKDYIRIRVGVGKPKYKSQVVDFVLNDFTQEESKQLDSLIEHISKSIKSLIDSDLNTTKSKYSLKSIESLNE